MASCCYCLFVVVSINPPIPPTAKLQGLIHFDWRMDMGIFVGRREKERRKMCFYIYKAKSF
jgi:hypothetical protein